LNLPKKKRKGFSRSKKQWEESIARHIGKFIDNLKGEDLLNLISAGICAYAGFNAAKQLGGDDIQAVSGAGSGIIAYQLAKSMNLIAGASGTAYLASLGILNLWSPVDVAAAAVGRAKTMPFPFGFGLEWPGGPPIIAP